MERDLVLKKEKIYVQKNKELRVKIIQLHYNMPVVGYRGRGEMMKLVMRNY